MKKSTVQASTDIALIKYWGKKDEVLRLPENGSVSVILDSLYTTTTVEFQKGLQQDEIAINDCIDKDEAGRVAKHLERIRKQIGVSLFAKVVSKNNFPSSTGLSSSGSGFGALTYAALYAAEKNLTEKEVSILARQGSGTACRSVCGGFVEWIDGDSSETSYSHTIFPKNHWDIQDVVVVIGVDKKSISSTEGHSLAQTSPFYYARLERIKEKIEKMKKYILEKDFSAMGLLAESEALEFHSILLTMSPSMIAWYPGTITVMKEVQKMREDGIEAYFTINTGFNVHVLTLPKHVSEVEKRLKQLSCVQHTILSGVGDKPKQIEQHLF